MTFEQWTEDYLLAWQSRDWDEVRRLQDDHPEWMSALQDDPEEEMEQENE